MDELQLAVENVLQKHRAVERISTLKSTLPNFTEWDNFLVAWEDSHTGVKLYLRWWDPRRIVKAANDYVYKVDGLLNNLVNEIRISRLKFYRHGLLCKDVIIFTLWVVKLELLFIV